MSIFCASSAYQEFVDIKIVSRVRGIMCLDLPANTMAASSAQPTTDLNNRRMPGQNIHICI